MRRILRRVGGKRGGKEGREERRDAASTFVEVGAESCFEIEQQAKALGELVEQEGTEVTEGAEQRPVLKGSRNGAWGHTKDFRESARWPACSYCVLHTGSTMRQKRIFMQPPHFAPF